MVNFLTVEFEILRKEILKSLIFNELDERKIQQICEHFESLSAFLPNTERITNFYIQLNEDKEKSDLYLFSDSFQIKVACFADRLQRSYAISYLKNLVKNLSITYEEVHYTQKINIEYTLDLNKNVSLSGIKENRIRLEDILKELLVKNILKNDVVINGTFQTIDKNTKD